MGVGLVMGWIAGQVAAWPGRTAKTAPAVSVGLLLAGVGVLLVSNGDAAAGYAPAALLGLGLSALWRRRLTAGATR